jgi:hypothetical protein
MVLAFCPGPASDCYPSTQHLPGSWMYKCMSSCLPCWLRWGFSKLLPRLASNHNPLDLILLSS